MATTLKLFVAAALFGLLEVSAWSCPGGYAGPNQCRGEHCDSNDVVLGSSAGDCCDHCEMRTRVGDHLEFVVGHECFAEQKSQCCNCWRWTGRRLNASEPQQGTPALRGAMAPVGEADEAAAEATNTTVMPRLSQAGGATDTVARAPALPQSGDDASAVTVLAAAAGGL